MGGLVGLRIRTSLLKLAKIQNLRIANLLTVVIRTTFEIARIPIFVTHDRRQRGLP